MDENKCEAFIQALINDKPRVQLDGIDEDGFDFTHFSDSVVQFVLFTFRKYVCVVHMMCVALKYYS